VVKYTEYTDKTGISTAIAQSTFTTPQYDNLPPLQITHPKFIRDIIPHLLTPIKQFVNDRDWAKFDHPRNLCFALIGKVGELAELVQFRHDTSSYTFPSNVFINELAQELADVAIYLFCFADILSLSFIHLE